MSLSGNQNSSGKIRTLPRIHPEAPLVVRKRVALGEDPHNSPSCSGADVEYSYPDGLIMPLVYGLRALIDVDENGCVTWLQKPARFVREHLPSIVKKYRVILDAFRFDPQKVGKNEGSYDLVLDAFETELMRQKQLV
jgi:hypothetical protein